MLHNNVAADGRPHYMTAVPQDYNGAEKVPSPSDIVVQRITHMFVGILIVNKPAVSHIQV